MGVAEVIVLAVETDRGRQGEGSEGVPGEDAFAQRFPRAGTMGPVVFHDDATALVDVEDWPESMR